MKCKNCRNLVLRKDDDGTLYHWCDMVVDCPDKEMERVCKYYVTASNADRIRSMSDEELAEFLDDATNCYCFPCTRDINNLEHFEKCKHESGSCEKEWLEWLKGEAE